MTDLKAAKALWNEIKTRLHPFYQPLGDSDESKIALITAALHAAEQRVWKRVTKQFDARFSATDERVARVRDYRVDEFYQFLKQQAHDRPGGGE